MKNRLVIFCVNVLVVMLLSGFASIAPTGKKDCIDDTAQVTAAVKTVAVKDITSTGAYCSYSIKAENVTVTRQGVCVNKKPNPTTDNNYYGSKGLGPINFSAEITGLSPNTKYYVRAFATTGSGTTYGNELTFTTLPAKK
jgi:hypothetical protein